MIKVTKFHPDPVVSLMARSEVEPEAMARALRNSPFANNPKPKAIIALIESIYGLSTIDEAVKLAEAAHSSRSHIELHIILLLLWHRALTHAGAEWRQLTQIKDAVRALIGPQTPPELHAWTSLIEAETYYSKGNTRDCFRLLEQLPALVNANSGHYARFTFISKLLCIVQGRGTAEQFAFDSTKLSPYDQAKLTQAIFVGAIARGALDEALALAQTVDELTHLPANLFDSQQNYQYVLELMCQHANKGAPGKLKHHAEPAWVKSTHYLLAAQPEAALEWARAHADDSNSSSGNMLVFDTHTLVRAELVMGHGEAAKRLLLQLRDEGKEHYMDEFYFARAEYQLNNLRTASHHFMNLNKAIEKYQARGRFEFEWGLACELSPADLLKLSMPAPKRTKVSKGPSSKPRYGIERLLHASPKIEQLCDNISQFAQLDLPVLITGETGTGKELAARALHEVGPRSQQPFIAINCGAISDALIESELFGHKRGAFTGAQLDHRGVFIDAGEGTVFLDEIGDISPRLQVALLRVLGTGEVRAVGSSKHNKLRCKIVAATNADLVKLAETGQFRKDLLYRLQRLEIDIPPLRERLADINLLLEHFLNINRDPGKHATVSAKLLQRFRQHPWPGNVRELRNAVERMRALNSDKLHYDVADWRSAIARPNSSKTPTSQQVSPHEPLQEPYPHDAQPPAPAPPTTRSRKINRSDAHQDIHQALSGGQSQLRRLKRLKALFEELEELNVSETAKLMNICRGTAARYLKLLLEEEFIAKIEPSASRQTHYYVLRQSIGTENDSKQPAML